MGLEEGRRMVRCGTKNGGRVISNRKGGQGLRRWGRVRGGRGFPGKDSFPPPKKKHDRKGGLEKGVRVELGSGFFGWPI